MVYNFEATDIKRHFTSLPCRQSNIKTCNRVLILDFSTLIFETTTAKNTFINVDLTWKHRQCSGGCMPCNHTLGKLKWHRKWHIEIAHI